MQTAKQKRERMEPDDKRTPLSPGDSVPLVSIFLYSYDFDALGDCLDSIFAQDKLDSFEVIICDNATTDGSWEMANAYMCRYPDRITLSRNQAPCSGSRNENKIKLQMVRGKYYVMLTSDRPFDPAYILQTIAQLQADPLLVHSYIGLTREFVPHREGRELPSPEMKRKGNPLVSVCIYNFEYGRYLSQCLESIAAQTYGHIEVCFSDNASTDDSWQIAMDFAKRYPKKMSLVRNRKNFGASSNQENTMYDARGKYMLFLCSDDAIRPEFVERCIALLEEHPDAAYAMVHRDIMDEEGRISSEPPFYDRSCLIRGKEQTAVYMMTSVNPCISQILYRRDLFMSNSRLGTLNSRWFGARILDFNLCCEYPMIYIKEPLLLNRVHTLSEGALLADNLLQCMSEYSLVHQFADAATSVGHDKAAGRLGEATEKIGRLCMRYSVRFLAQDNASTALRYFRLAEAIFPGIAADPVYTDLAHYWATTDDTEKLNIVAKLGRQANLSTRAVSYPPPPGSIPC